MYDYMLFKYMYIHQYLNTQIYKYTPKVAVFFFRATSGTKMPSAIKTSFGWTYLMIMMMISYEDVDMYVYTINM
jgi:hypothetical protein